MRETQEYLNLDIAKKSIANTDQLTFEVTDMCNLNCTYCGYGDLYSDHDKRDNKMLSVKKAINLIDYMNDLWTSPYNHTYMKDVFISFYGGEPLLNMEFISTIVDYIKNLKCQSRRFLFSMTTNAMLLDRYMDYLVSNNFNVLISLDGNKDNMGYRIDKSGNSSFDRITKNVDLLREKFPDYFDKYINFNAVLHNKNSVESIHSYFKEKYNKVPRIGELNNVGIREDKIEDFNTTYRNLSEDLNQSEHYTEIMKDMSISLATSKSITTYLMQYSNFVFRDYNELLYGKQTKITIPTGTCMPFSKKVFMTVNGKILPCERIGHQFALGIVTDDSVEINFEYIVNKYNVYYTKIDKQCKLCYNRNTCIQCIFNLPDINEKRPICHGYMNQKDFEAYQNAQISFLANNPEEYFRLMEDVIVV
ncbi:radical SAM peptide maturase [Dysgonomonas sp. ZJ709]|uniref:radical SAM peptide maturase n=1 Tax=Dysgonomonas sp. ZJ709 TaxID=2709797 RepID=UPI0013EB7DC9|nr:radical SAM peptide maturase [Dysgonomonas sp. ZJ709]